MNAYYCHFCFSLHDKWVEVADLEVYYGDVGTRPQPPIYQCPACLFRIPFAHMWAKDAETCEIVQEYEQTQMF